MPWHNFKTPLSELTCTVLLFAASGVAGVESAAAAAGAVPGFPTSTNVVEPSLRHRPGRLCIAEQYNMAVT